jgi:RsiW-degrading membrane proteinase PrsW (M82 family)
MALFRRHFNDPLDGLIYGSFAGLGAAIEESITVLGFADGPILLPGQEPVRLAGHLIMGGIGGFGLGMRPLADRRWHLWALATLAAAALLHTLWDVVAFHAHDHADLHARASPWHTAAGVLLMLAGMVVFRWLVRRGAALSRRVFAPVPALAAAQPAAAQPPRPTLDP